MTTLKPQKHADTCTCTWCFDRIKAENEKFREALRKIIKQERTVSETLAKLTDREVKLTYSQITAEQALKGQSNG